MISLNVDAAIGLLHLAAMKRQREFELILTVCRPKKRNAPGRLFGVAAGTLGRLLGGQQPNAQRTISKRMMDACKDLQEDIHFLAGVLTLLPFLDLRRSIEFKDDGEKLLVDAYSFYLKCEPSTASVRKMRIFGERILRFVEKVENDAKKRP